MKPIYEPKGRAGEYGDFAVNIYSGCPHRCYYCFAPQVLHREREQFHLHTEPRAGIVDAVKRQLEKDAISGKLIHLCFTCDPYPAGADTTPTREIIKAIKAAGNNVQILTKGDGRRDFYLLDCGDWYGVTYSCDDTMARAKEPGAVSPSTRLLRLEAAKAAGIKTWVSFEPVLDAQAVLSCIKDRAGIIDKAKIGKLNYWTSDIDWRSFGRAAEMACQEAGLDYYIKEDLRKKMEEAT